MWLKSFLVSFLCAALGFKANAVIHASFSGIQAVAVQVRAEDGKAIADAKVEVVGTGLDRVANGELGELQDVAKAARGPRRTDKMGYTVAYYFGRSGSTQTEKGTSYQLGVTGTLKVEAEGYTPFEIELGKMFKAESTALSEGQMLLAKVTLKRAAK